MSSVMYIHASEALNYVGNFGDWSVKQRLKYREAKILSEIILELES